MSHGKKPAKPYPEFPLFAHANGKWAKKIKGKFVYFGRWADHENALREFRQYQKRMNLVAMDAKQPPPATTVIVPDNGTITMGALLNCYLSAAQERVEAGELSKRSWLDYERTANHLGNFFGRRSIVANLAPEDWRRFKESRAKTLKAIAMGNEIQRVKTVMKWARDAELLVADVRFGPDFKKPSARTLRKERYEKGEKLFTAGEIRAVMNESGVNLRAMVLLGINCAYRNQDCSDLPISAIDWDAGWLRFPRTKNFNPRHNPLWPETVVALRQALDCRPVPDDKSEKRLFLTHDGRQYSDGLGNDNIKKQFNANLMRMKLHRPMMGFSWLRSTFATIGVQVGDELAVKHMMGHIDNSMLGVYVQQQHDPRLLKVSNHVREWFLKESDNGSS